MTLAEQLREYNDWRRGGDFSQPNPRDLGVLIDKSADRLEAAEKLIEQLESALESTAYNDGMCGVTQFFDDAKVDEALAALKQWKESA